MDIATGTVTNTVSGVIIVPLIQQVIQQIDDVIHLDENRNSLEEALNRMKLILLDIHSQFRDQQREAPVSLKNCLQRMQLAVAEGRELIHRSQRPLRWTNYLLCKPKVATQIRELKTSFNGLFDQLSTDFSLFCSTQQIVSVARQQEAVLLQDQPDTGLVGLEIKSAEIQLKKWLKKARRVGIICVYGMGGVGKTTLLKKVYNNHKVSHIFDHVIWVTVSQFSILELQSRIAYAIGLDLSKCSSNDVDTRKMKLSAYLTTKKFLLILDDMWSLLNLKELGVEFGPNKGSKLVFSTRNRNLISEMNAEESIRVQPLTTEEARDLFCRIAFKDGHVPEDIMQIAREVASECKGLPLAINVIASTMIGNTAINQWKFALRQMQTVDLNFPITHPRIDRDLYQRLRWSYDNLPNAALKNCFLYCALFEEDAEIPVERLVQMWISEGLVKANNGDYDYLLETGHNIVKLLENRSLIQMVEPVDGFSYWMPWSEDQSVLGRQPVVRIHDVMRDMAIYIGEKEENYVCRAGQGLSHFPDIEAQDDCKRISIRNNAIVCWPREGLRCPNLVSLLLGGNRPEIPKDFFSNFPFLKVLQLQLKEWPLQQTTWPTSLWQLTQLEFLDLSYSEITHIPAGLDNLFRLQFLCLWHCDRLVSFPRELGNLKNLKYLDIRHTPDLVTESIPSEIKKLSKCKIVANNVHNGA